ncbi:MAG: PRC-barrel domain-containing protein [Hyphomicrobiales bacterium]|nr:PRC-barrel domain-containing protein [Hyphomicrobiales bacterium]
MRTIAILAGAAAIAAGSAAYAQTSVAPRTTLVSNVYDKTVYDKGENKIGTIDDLIVDPDGKISAAVIGVGGFVGVGEKDVKVPFTDIKWRTDKNNKAWLELDRTKDQLKAEPAFDTKAMKN